MAFYLGQPYDLGDSSTFIIPEGAEIIRTYGRATEEQLAYLDSHILGVKNAETETAVSTENAVTSIEETDTPQNNLNKPDSAGNGSESAQGQTSTVEVSGSDYFKDHASEYEIPLYDLADAFGATSIKAQFYQIKDLKNDFNPNESKVNTNSVKMFIAFYKGLDYDFSKAESFQTVKSAEILKKNGNLTEEQLAYLEAHTYG